jgi:hypothetical protein
MQDTELLGGSQFEPSGLPKNATMRVDDSLHIAL